MPVKLLMMWDILPNREQEYFEFVVGEFIPEIKVLGIKPVDAWYTMYGQAPQITVSAKAESQAELEAVMASSEWDRLVNDLLDYVEDFSYKIVPARPGFQL